MILAGPILVVVVVIGGALLVGGWLGYGAKPLDAPPAAVVPLHAEPEPPRAPAPEPERVQSP